MSYYKGKRDLEKTRIARYIIRTAKKIKAIQLKGGKCSICGISDLNKPWIYQFHHTDKNNKEDGIHKLLGVSFSRIEKELEKCICVCENCHRKIHSDEMTLEESTFNKLLFLNYKNIKCCNNCGYDDCIKSLDFHHIEKKEIELANIVGKDYNINELSESLKKELDKCVVLCSNCHRGMHSDQIMFEIYKSEIFKKIENLKGNYTTSVNHEKVLELNKQGLSQKKISKKLNCGLSTVCEILKQNGIHTFLKRPELDVNIIIKLKKEGKNNQEISKILNCHPGSIPHVIRKHKLKTNS